MCTEKIDKPFISLENAKVENAKCFGSEGWDKKPLFLAFHDQNLHARACTAFTAASVHFFSYYALLLNEHLFSTIFKSYFEQKNQRFPLFHSQKKNFANLI